ncbi:MAG: 4-(cytidine 5'-diphospho)-2-C-methyl-D-erythritol kinase [Pseudomonadota bacterium]
MPSQTTVKAFAPANVNLTLHVSGRRTDGYHVLDSLVAFADVGDTLGVHYAHEMGLTVSGDMADGVPEDATNLVWKAAQLFAPKRPVRIYLEKALPVAAGIGGGSSDAAAILRALARLEDRPWPDSAAALGADIPVCLRPRAQRMSGIGDILDPVALPPLAAVLVNPGVEVPTQAVFRGLQAADNPAMDDHLPDWDSPEAAIDWIAQQRNDLEPPARALAPEIDEVLDELRLAPACSLARMSGSGATCFGLFPDMATARAAASVLAAQHPLWWVVPTLLS